MNEEYEVIHTTQENDPWEVVGSIVNPEGWDGVIGTLVDRGKVIVSEGDYWFWWLVQKGSVYYLGLPGLQNFHRVTKKIATNRALLDSEIRSLI